MEEKEEGKGKCPSLLADYLFGRMSPEERLKVLQEIFMMAETKKHNDDVATKLINMIYNEYSEIENGDCRRN